MPPDRTLERFGSCLSTALSPQQLNTALQFAPCLNEPFFQCPFFTTATMKTPCEQRLFETSTCRAVHYFPCHASRIGGWPAPSLSCLGAGVTRSRQVQQRCRGRGEGAAQRKLTANGPNTGRGSLCSSGSTKGVTAGAAGQEGTRREVQCRGGRAGAPAAGQKANRSAGSSMDATAAAQWRRHQWMQVLVRMRSNRQAVKIDSILFM